MDTDSVYLQFINKVDFDLLRRIYEKPLSRFGVTAEQGNFLGPDRITNQDMGINRGNFNIATNQIDLNFTELRRVYPEIPPEKLLSIMLRILCHEEWHTVSFREFRGFKHSLQSGFYRREGSSVLSMSGPIAKENFLAFNEGVSDIMGEAAFRQFMRRTRQRWEIPAVELSSNVEETQMVRELVRAIAKKKQLPSEQVWAEIIRGSIKGERFTEGSILKEWLESSLYEGGLEDLADALPHTEAVRTIIDRLPVYELQARSEGRIKNR